MVVIVWIIFSFIVGMIGSGRKIGFFGAFFLSLILSPVIGLIITIISKSKSDMARDEKMIKLQEDTNRILSANNISSDLQNLTSLKEKGLITEDEFLRAKSKLFNS